MHTLIEEIKKIINSHKNVISVKDFISSHENVTYVKNFINSHENIISVENFISFHHYDNNANEIKIDNHESFAYRTNVDELCIFSEIVLIFRKSQTIILSKYLKNLDTNNEKNVFSEKDVFEFRFSASTDFVSKEQLVNNIDSRLSSVTSSYEIIMQQNDKDIISSTFHIALKM